ncbi:TetR/AcrR family transcriptional regulator [Brevibacillus formosus]|uniref:TetR/AcrR family transcriptional regulator n=1 Tax=Brevibacillus formosus TaxID=54913 RepID=UPI003F1C2899
MARTVNEKMRDERRRQILEAATLLFAQHGFSQSTITQIAKAAGVSHATIFLYFPNKDDLFQTVVLEPLDAAKKFYISLIAQGNSPLERLHSLIRGQIHRSLYNATYLRLVQYALGQPERFPIVAKELNQYVTRFVNDIIPIIEEGQHLGELNPGNPFYIAWAYFSYYNGIGMCYLEPNDESINELVKNGLRIFGPVEKDI